MIKFYRKCRMESPLIIYDKLYIKKIGQWNIKYKYKINLKERKEVK